MLKLRSLNLFGLALSLLLVFQSALACYDGHGELEAAGQHLPAGHQDAADGTPHLDQTASQDQTQGDNLQLRLVTPADHTDPDIAQDCNHCCHCHSAFTYCLPVSLYSSVSGTGHQWFAAADARFPHGVTSTLYRPPIV